MNGNPYTSSWIGATAQYPIYDYINEVGSNSSNYTNNTSNILETHSSNFTNSLRYDMNKWINEEIEPITFPTNTNLTHTYIYNSNLSGEIRFWCKSTPFFPPQIPGDYPSHRVKIDPDGKLKLYYTYDSTINATWLNGWVDIVNLAVSLVASDVNMGISIAALDQKTNKKIDTQILAVYNAIAAVAAGDLGDDLESLQDYKDNITTALNNTQAQDNLNTTYQNVGDLINTRNSSYLTRIQTTVSTAILQNPLTAFATGTGGVVLGIVYGIAQNIAFNNYLNSLTESIESNIHLTTPEKQNLKDYVKNDLMVKNDIERAQLEYDKCINQGFITSNILSAQNYISSNTVANLYVSSNVFSNLAISRGFINSNITTQQLIPSLKTSLLNLNGGNIVNVNNITALGKIKENNNFLESTYATLDYVNSNLYNNSYTEQRLYPPKTFNSYTLAISSLDILGRDCFKETINLTTDNITYGSGEYIVYSSSSYGNSDFNRRNLFNYTINSAAFFENGNYNYETGYFNRNDLFLKYDYFGDWVVIKLLSKLILKKIILYYTNIYSAPSLWRFYGSNDGLIFTEIIEASNYQDALIIDSYSGGFYEKTFNNTKEYLYFGIVINKIIGGNISASYLNFGQFQLYGINTNIYNNLYTTSNAVKSIVRNEMPDVGKRNGFIVEITSSATYYDNTSSTTYYKYDLDLRNYTKTAYLDGSNDPYRIFKIRLWYGPSYFGSYLNGVPYVVNYEVYMSNKANPVFGRPETAGVNIFAIGDPENSKLSNILPNNIMLLKNGFNNFNYLTIVSRDAPCSIMVIIEDMLN